MSTSDQAHLFESVRRPKPPRPPGCLPRCRSAPAGERRDRQALDSQIAADQALLEATSESYRLSEMRFRDGVDDYLGVLDSQRSLYTAQQTLVGVKLSRLQNLVTLYKALGGGWNEHSPQNAGPAAAGTNPSSVSDVGVNQ
jgi:hypothetical protein